MLSFDLYFRELSDLTSFKDFLEKWSQNYRIIVGNLCCTGERRFGFMVSFSISGEKTNDLISSDQVCRLIKFVSDARIHRDEHLQLNDVHLVTNEVKGDDQ